MSEQLDESQRSAEPAQSRSPRPLVSLASRSLLPAPGAASGPVRAGIYETWLAGFDVGQNTDSISPVYWVSTAAVLALFCFGVSRFDDGLRAHLFCIFVQLGITTLYGICGTLAAQRRAVSVRVLPILFLISYGAWSAVFVAVAVVSEGPGVVLGVSLACLSAWAQGQLLSSSWRAPVPTAFNLVGVASALLWKHDSKALVMVGAVAVGSTFLEWLRGAFHASVQRYEELKKRGEGLQSALIARMLADQARRYHDVKNAAQTVAFLGEELSYCVKSRDWNQIEESLARFLPGVDRLVEQTRTHLRPSSALGTGEPTPGREYVEVDKLLPELVGQLSRRFRVEIRADVKVSRFLFSGGEAAFTSLLENLLVNACEGDGRKRARHIDVELTLEGRTLRLVVRDDGPGLPPKIIEGRHQVFETSKLKGNGLGLYTIESLVRANGGSVIWQNAPTGGAHIVITMEVKRERGVPTPAS